MYVDIVISNVFNLNKHFLFSLLFLLYRMGYIVIFNRLAEIANVTVLVPPMVHICSVVSL